MSSEHSTQYRYIPFTELPYAYGGPVVEGLFKQTPEDFRVEEQLCFVPQGQGEHVYLLVEKEDLNSQDVRVHLSKCAQVKLVDVGYGGLKDKNSIARQWFSVYLPGTDREFTPFQGMRILQHTRHIKKLRQTMVRGNHFEISLRNISGDRRQLQELLKTISLYGVPNYFGEQRFGRQEKNLNSAIAYFNKALRCNRFKRGIYLSAARSYLFNLVLAERVRRQDWQQILPGEAVILDGKHSFFHNDLSDSLGQRLQAWDIHPSGPLWGRGELPSQTECQALERKILENQLDLVQGLESAGLRHERRPLRIRPGRMSWNLSETDLQIQFELGSGEYATSVLRECIRMIT